ncbi:MAG TPA: hypothetical protein VMJ10_23920 [Kofleriaceae bacterium]|nr:hypothetical protein [Kofleriaceae bacterium]
MAPKVFQGAQVVLDQGVYSATAFGAAVLVGRTGGHDGLAYLSLSQTLLASSLVLQRCVLGVPYSVLSRSMTQIERRPYIGATLIQHVVVTAIAALIFGISSLMARALGASAELYDCLLVMTCVGPAMLFRDFVRTVLLAELSVSRSLVLSIASNALGAALLFYLSCRGELSASTALMAMGAFAVPCALVCGLRSLSWADRGEVYHYARKNWEFGKYTLAGNVLSLAVMQVVPWLLLAVGTTDDVAILAAASSTAGLIRPVTLGIGSYLAPLFAQQYAKDGRAPVLRATVSLLKQMLVFIFAFVGLLTVVGPACVRLLFGSSYAIRGPLVLVACAAAGEALSVVLRATARAVHEPGTETISSAVSAVIGIAAAAMLIPIIGVYGAALSLGVTQMVFVMTSLSRLLQTNGVS